MYNFSIILYLLLLCSCAKKPDCTVYLFGPNAQYTGTQNNKQINGSVTITDADSGILIKTKIIGLDHTKNYALHIHEQELGTPFGYTGNPVIGESHQHTTTEQEFFSSKYTYKNFIQNVKGFFVVHDPTFVSNDTVSLLVYERIGAW